MRSVEKRFRKPIKASDVDAFSKGKWGQTFGPHFPSTVVTRRYGEAILKQTLAGKPAKVLRKPMRD